MIPYRYVWAYRELMCRSIHDMGKQKWDSKKYSPVAWSPLTKWVRDAPAAQLDLRRKTLVGFTDKDTEFWNVVAKCLVSEIYVHGVQLVVGPCSSTTYCVFSYS